LDSAIGLLPKKRLNSRLNCLLHRRLKLLLTASHPWIVVPRRDARILMTKKNGDVLDRNAPFEEGHCEQISESMEMRVLDLCNGAWPAYPNEPHVFNTRFIIR
jgi:hypothetical protein